LNEKAREIEDYINERCEDTPEHVFTYYEIASDLSLGKKVVKDFLSPLGGGSNGITVHNPMLNKK